MKWKSPPCPAHARRGGGAGVSNDWCITVWTLTSLPHKSRSTWNLEVLVFVEGEKPEKNPGSKARTNPHETASTGTELGSQRWEVSAYPLRQLCSLITNTKGSWTCKMESISKAVRQSLQAVLFAQSQSWSRWMKGIRSFNPKSFSAKVLPPPTWSWLAPNVESISPRLKD